MDWYTRLKHIGELQPNIVGSWNLKRVFLYGTNPYSPDAVINLVEGTTHRIITDHLGSPRMVVDASSGDIVQEIDYDTWGNVIADSNPGAMMFGFAGGMYDLDTGLVRFGARDYDPSIGRWLDRDPIGFAGGANWYVYVGDNPVNRIDPQGTSIMDAISGIMCTDNNCAIVGDILGSAISTVYGGNYGGIGGGVIGGLASGYVGQVVGVCGNGGIIGKDQPLPRVSPIIPDSASDVCLSCASKNVPSVKQLSPFQKTSRIQLAVHSQLKREDGCDYRKSRYI